MDSDVIFYQPESPVSVPGRPWDDPILFYRRASVYSILGDTMTVWVSVWDIESEQGEERSIMIVLD